MQITLEQCCGLLPSNAQTSDVLKPRERSFHSRTSVVAPQRPSILCDVLFPSVAAMRCDHLNALVRQCFVKLIAVVCFVADHTRRRFAAQHENEKTLNALALVRTGRHGVDGRWKASPVDQDHYFYPFSYLRLSDAVAAALGFGKCPVNKSLVQAIAVALIDASPGILHDPLTHALPDPFLKPTVRRALRAEAFRKVFPFGAVIKDPVDALHGFAKVDGRSAAARIFLGLGNSFHQPVELFIRECQHNDTLYTKPGLGIGSSQWLLDLGDLAGQNHHPLRRCVLQN